jgi:large subunit ribosomal protein L23
MEILLRPLLTEKTQKQQNKDGVFGFLVDKRANKVAIRKAVEKLYSVNVNAVRTMITPGKAKVKHTKAGLMSGRTSSLKKAFVKLAEGQVIDFYGEF